MMHADALQPAGVRRPSGLSDAEKTLLMKLPLFSGLTEEEFFRLIEGAWTETFPSQSLLFLQDDEADHFYVVLQGWVKLFRATADGQEGVISVIPAGQSFAEAAIFQSGRYPVSASTLDETRLLAIPAASFIARVVEDSSYALKILASMSCHLHRLVNQVEELALKSSVERVAGYLSELCPNDAGPASIRLPLDKAIIAQRLGMQPETLSRSFARLRNLGVESKGGQVRIDDVSALRQFGHGDCAPHHPN